MHDTQTTVGTTELAQLLGISRQRVNELCRQGKIPREADGRWNADRVRGALDRNLDQRQRHAGRQQARAGITARELYERIRDGLERFPAVLMEAHPAVPVWAALAVVEALDLGIGSIVLDIDEDLIADDQQFPATEPDYRALFKALGVCKNSAEWDAAQEAKESFLIALNAALWPEQTVTGRHTNG